MEQAHIGITKTFGNDDADGCNETSSRLLEVIPEFATTHWVLFKGITGFRTIRNAQSGGEAV